MLYHFESNHWHSYTPVTLKHKYAYYKHYHITMPLNHNDLLPVMLMIQHDRITITIPLASVLLKPAATPATTTTLKDKLKEPPQEWE